MHFKTANSKKLKQPQSRSKFALFSLGVISISLAGCISSPKNSFEGIASSNESASLQKSDLNNAPEIDYSLKQVSGGGQLKSVPVPRDRTLSVTANSTANTAQPASISDVIKSADQNGGVAPVVKTAKIIPKTVPTTATALAAPPKKRKSRSLFDFFSNPTPRPKAKVKTKTKSNTRVVRAADDDGTVKKRKSGVFSIFSTKKKSKKTRVASLASLTRTKKNLILQTSRVKVNCFKPGLLGILQKVRKRYGKRVIVTSGYRSASDNRRARGVKNSAHVRCMAADIQVPGVTKWKLASYLRTLPGRGGVGTYCHTQSVHIDIGKKRDWNWRCRKRRKRK